MIETQTLLYERNIDVISIAESWLTPDHDSSHFSIPNYDLLRNDRGLKSITGKRKYMQAGGVACYIRSDIRYEVLEAPQITDFNETEFMLISLELEQRLLLASVYRRPKGNVLNEFFIMLQIYTHLYNNIIIAGDLNSDLLDCNNYYGTHLMNHIYENSLYLVPFNAATTESP